MCGIAGLLDPGRRVAAAELGHRAEEMSATITHRGPDAHGVWCDPDGGIALGSVRLAVVGLGANGDQPMHSADGRYVLSYNGELYNYRSLRTRLAREGAAFEGTSDTEVLVEAVARWGLATALEASEGMFAFALWDRHQRRLHLVRDRFGEKPLYYGWVGDCLAFGSELKALCRLADFDADIDRDAVALFLRHNCVPAPRTIYRGVAKLSPGQHLAVDPDIRPKATLTPSAYWSARDAIEAARSRPHVGSSEAMVDQLEATLSDSVAARMVADVPVGAFLSGGVDSSLVVALMQRHHSRPVRTFTVGFAERAFDESARGGGRGRPPRDRSHRAHSGRRGRGRASSRSCPTSGTSPSATSPRSPCTCVSKLARTEVTVALSGDGGDELFAGYNRHAWLERIWRRAAPLPAGLRRTVGPFDRSTTPRRRRARGNDGGSACRRDSQVRNPAFKVAKVGKVLAAAGPEDAYLALVSYWDDAESHGDRCRSQLCRSPDGRRTGRLFRASPSRCCGSIWSATCPTTS